MGQEGLWAGSLGPGGQSGGFLAVLGTPHFGEQKCTPLVSFGPILLSRTGGNRAPRTGGTYYRVRGTHYRVHPGT